MGHFREYCGDLVLNQNPQAREGMYAHRSASTGLLLGSGYAMLRREFRSWRGNRHKPASAHRVLVTLGGADPANTTLKVIRAVRQLTAKKLEVIVLVGPANPYRAELDAEVRGAEQSIELKNSVSNMPELMAWADFAISAAGSTCWELAFMGVPNLLIVLAENQSGGAEALQKLEVSRNLGWHAGLQPETIATELGRLLDDTETRHQMSECGRALIDGEGVMRVIEELHKGVTSAAAPGRLNLRPATIDDAETLWNWANDPDVRSSAFSQAQIPWENHVKWLSSKLQAPDCLILLASDSNAGLVGQIRFDIRGNEAWIDLSLASEARGRGLAAELIRNGVSYAAHQLPAVKHFRAEVKAANARSGRAFLRSGFMPVGQTDHDGAAVVQLTCQR